jgi:hypothetical protein
MGTYPYPPRKSFPSNDMDLEYFLNYNTREVSGNEPQAYRVDYGPAK